MARLGRFLKGEGGLKQGDPVSPLLFVLSMEYFTRLMKTASSNPQFAFHPSCSALKLNHLMFTDDVLIFYRAHPETLAIIHHTLSIFYQCIGLKANLTKS